MTNFTGYGCQGKFNSLGKYKMRRERKYCGAFGSSTVVRYSRNGAVLNTWTIKGNVDGLNIDPASGLVWALQNNDGNSALTTINPLTSATTAFTYRNTYTNVANRGFDDVVFTHGNVFISETNPASGTDAIVVKLTSGLNSPLQISPILNSTFTGSNLATGMPGSVTIADSDSLEFQAHTTTAKRWPLLPRNSSR